MSIKSKYASKSCCDLHDDGGSRPVELAQIAHELLAAAPTNRRRHQTGVAAWNFDLSAVVAPRRAHLSLACGC